jgi:thiol-disulfide isomerase/thioredoxin
MDTWKIVVIVLLLGGLGGYGFYQQNAASAPPEAPIREQPETPSEGKINKLKGKTVPAWNFAKQNWVNTPAPVAPSQLKGKVTLMEFWRIGCSHCEEAAPHMEKLFKEYSPRGVKFVAIHSPGAPDEAGDPNPENNWGTVKQKIKEWGITYPVAFDEGGKLFQNTYGGETYPTLIILDRHGIVRHISTGYTAQKEVQIRQVLETELKKK